MRALKEEDGIETSTDVSFSKIPPWGPGQVAQWLKGQTVLQRVQVTVQNPH